MFRCLKGEMVKANLTVSKLAIKIGITEKTLRNKINGETEFNWSEVLKIRKLVAPSMSLEDLFYKDEAKE